MTHALLGMWCYVAFTQVSDPFVDLVSFSMTIIYSAGISGRNCANSRFVVVQILCVWAPNNGRAPALRKSLSLDFCRLSRPVVSRDKISSGEIAPHPA